MYSNFDIGYPLHGPLEEIASDYMLLSEDPKGKLCLSRGTWKITCPFIETLPEAFTICSSIYMKNVVTNQYFYQLYKVEGLLVPKVTQDLLMSANLSTKALF